MYIHTRYYHKHDNLDEYVEWAKADKRRRSELMREIIRMKAKGYEGFAMSSGICAPDTKSSKLYNMLQDCRKAHPDCYVTYVTGGMAGTSKREGYKFAVMYRPD